MLAESEKLYTIEEYEILTRHSDKLQELINGEIYDMASPNEIHQRIVMRLGNRIDSYILKNQGKCKVILAPFDVKLNEHTIVIPDVLVVCDPSKMDGKRCVGAPDWIIEVLSSNRDTDLITKQALYKNNHVREYWIVDPKNEKTLVYFFEKNDLPDIYTFDTAVPVEIYDRKLSINISELLKGNLT